MKMKIQRLFQKEKTLTRRTLVAMALVVAASMPMQGQSPLRLSLQEAEDFAVSHNYSMQNASLEVKKAKAAEWETFSTLLPQVKGSFDYSSMCGYEMNIQGMSIPMNPYGTLGITASVAVTSQQIMGTVMNKIATRMSDITAKQTEQETRANVKNVYVSILVMQQTIELLDSSLANLNRLAQITEESARVGAAEQVDADKIAVQVATLQNTKNNTANSLKLLNNTLLLQLGVDVESTVELTSTLEDILDVNKAVQVASKKFDIEKNYSYMLLKENEKLSKDQLTLAWLAFTPTLSFFYQYSYKTYFGKDEGFNMTPPNMIGAGLSLPIFESGTRIASIRKAKIAHQETLNSKQQAEDGLKVQYKQLCYDLANAVENYRIQSLNIDVTNRVFTSTSENYKYGRASSLELTNASTEIINAQTNYIQAVMEVVSAQVALENMMNGDN